MLNEVEAAAVKLGLAKTTVALPDLVAALQVDGKRENLRGEKPTRT